MTDYSKTKIYIIRSPNTANVYVGATVQRLSSRFSSHTSKFRTGQDGTKAVEVLKHGDAYIELLESFPCDNIDESNARERHWIRQFQEKKVNCIIPGVTNNKNYIKYKKTHRRKYECRCGITCIYTNRARHFKSIRHRTWIFNEHNIFNHL